MWHWIKVQPFICSLPVLTDKCFIIKSYYIVGNLPYCGWSWADSGPSVWCIPPAVGFMGADFSKTKQAMPSLSSYLSNLPTIDSGVLSLGQVKHAIILMSMKVINWVRNMPRIHFRWSFIPCIQLVMENQVGDKASEQPNKIKTAGTLSLQGSRSRWSYKKVTPECSASIITLGRLTGNSSNPMNLKGAKEPCSRPFSWSPVFHC